MIDRDGAPTRVGDETRTEEVVRKQYDWSSLTPSTAVVEAVAAATGRDPTTIEPLYERIDPDALDALVGANGTTPDSENVSVSFSFAELLVTVQRNGEVVVRADGSFE